MLRPLSVALLAALPVQAQDAGLFAQGQALPDLELPTLDGSATLNLSELRGTPTLLIQFASW